MASSQPSQNVELEAAKFLHKLIEDSTDEPAKLATKLYVILQHMKTSGKEHSMPYQVISRAMETVINQHGLDIEALMSQRLPLSGAGQTGDSVAPRFAGPTQAHGSATDFKPGMLENEMPKIDPFGSSRLLVAPSGASHDYYQGSGNPKSSQSFDHESPSSLDTRCANSQSQERGGNQRDGKKATAKRRRGDSSLSSEQHIENAQQLDASNSIVDPRKGKVNKVDSSAGFPARVGDNSSFNMVPNSGHAEATSAQSSGQHGAAFPPGHEILSARGMWNQNKPGLANERSQIPKFPSNAGNVATEIPLQTNVSSIGSSGFSRVHGIRGKVLDSDGGSALMFTDPSKIIQGGRQSGNSEMTMRPGTSRDMGKSPVSQGPMPNGMPFKEQQLKQLRAQCLVFLSFRNAMMPKKLHLEIALGNVFPKDGGIVDVPRKELIEHKGNIGKSQSLNEMATIVDAAAEFGRQNNVREVERAPSGPSSTDDRKNLLAGRLSEAELQSPETVDSQVVVAAALQLPDSTIVRGSLPSNSLVHIKENGHLQVTRADQSSSTMNINNQVNPDATSWTGIRSQNENPRAPLTSMVQHELLANGKDNFPEHDEEDNSTFPHSPKYTMSDKWISDHQRKKLLLEQNWVFKQQKTKQKITTCYNKLKETVSSSEDISAKTKSVIELKKLQLLELQRRLRSDFLNDFFKPIASDVDRLRAFKKHKHGRRIKQLEKYEQKMKEERQKRIRERQKEFFSEIEVHKERLEDVFKIKRERWKGYNKYVREYHKRKERFHREKIDRIQREKINLLKINDVEGYLRMVQDAKSDRVKQLLKETEKYLQKLGSKLQEAKSVASRFENDMDEARNATFVETYETTIENEDESDQAKHYLESNENYYKMAHSVKESIVEQPTCLLGGKLREYQMNGLRWLVSLYNNHLNGILADEMGLGKTVQVIALICYLMETKNDRGPFLVVVPSSVLPGWESEINFWAPSVHKIVYSGPPEERRRLFKEKIVHQKFNVLLTTYEYLMNKHDRPKLSKVQWHYIIIDEGHRIKNASCKLNADLKHYKSSHRLLLTGTPLQNNLEELWALLNFLLPNIFNSSEDFSQWFNKPFESNGDNSADEALLSEEENLLIINRLHQVLRPFVLRRLKHKVENELPEKIERLIRCEASAYQKLLMKRVEENLGTIGHTKARSVHNSVMEHRNICNHPYISQLHSDEVDNLIPKHFLPPIIRHCGKLEMLDRLLPKLKATDHRVLFFSTMTRLLDVMEEYLTFKQYKYLRLDGHTSGADRGSLIDKFNQSGSPYFIFLLSIRAGGVGVNLQAADTVIIFDTDWNPQVDLQAQARAHRIGQKRDVLVLRFETVQTVEEQVRASAEHKLGVANQSITAGFFDNNTSAEDRREYLEALLRECKKEEATPVLDDDALNDILARSEEEIDIFESVDSERRDQEIARWKNMLVEKGMNVSEPLPPLPPRLITDDDLKKVYEIMKLYDVPKAEVPSNAGLKRKGQHIGGLDTQHYGRGKRAREVRSYEEQWTEEEFEKMCQADSPGSPKLKEEAAVRILPLDNSGLVASVKIELPAAASAPAPALAPTALLSAPSESLYNSAAGPAPQQIKEATPPSKRGRGRPRRIDKPPVAPSAAVAIPAPSAAVSAPSFSISNANLALQEGTEPSALKTTGGDSFGVAEVGTPQPAVVVSSSLSSTPSVSIGSILQSTALSTVLVQPKGQGQKPHTVAQSQSEVQAPRRRGKKQNLPSSAHENLPIAAPNRNEQVQNVSISSPVISGKAVSNTSISHSHIDSIVGVSQHSGSAVPLASPPHPIPVIFPIIQSSPSPVPVQISIRSPKVQSGPGAPRRRGRKAAASQALSEISAAQFSKSDPVEQNKSENLVDYTTSSSRGNEVERRILNQEQTSIVIVQDPKLPESSNYTTQHSQATSESTVHKHDNAAGGSSVPALNADKPDAGAITSVVLMETSSSKVNMNKQRGNESRVVLAVTASNKTSAEVLQKRSLEETSSIGGPPGFFPPCAAIKIGSSSLPTPSYPANVATSELPSPDAVQVKRPGRKPSNKVETTSRRGRKPGPVLTVVDASANADPKLFAQSQNKSRDSSGSTGMSLRSKQESEHKEPSNVVQINAFGRIQTADVTDVARVMKEIFSETCSSKTKALDPKNVDQNILPSKITLETAKKQNLEEKPKSPIAAFGAAVPAVISNHSPECSGSGLAVSEEENNVVTEASNSKIEVALLGESDESSRLAEGSITSIDMQVKVGSEHQKELGIAVEEGSVKSIVTAQDTDLASGDQLDGLSSEAKYERAAVSDALHMGSDYADVELPSKDSIAEHLSPISKSGGHDSVEAGSFEIKAPSEESAMLDVPVVDDREQPTSEVGNTKGKGNVLVVDDEEQPTSKESAMPDVPGVIGGEQPTSKESAMPDVPGVIGGEQPTSKESAMPDVPGVIGGEQPTSEFEKTKGKGDFPGVDDGKQPTSKESAMPDVPGVDNGEQLTSKESAMPDVPGVDNGEQLTSKEFAMPDVPGVDDGEKPNSEVVKTKGKGDDESDVEGQKSGQKEKDHFIYDTHQYVKNKESVHKELAFSNLLVVDDIPTKLAAKKVQIIPALESALPPFYLAKEVGKVTAVEESQGSEEKMLDRTDASRASESVVNHSSETLNTSSSPLTSEEEKHKLRADQPSFDSSTAMNDLDSTSMVREGLNGGGEESDQRGETLDLPPSTSAIEEGDFVTSTHNIPPTTSSVESKVSALKNDGSLAKEEQAFMGQFEDVPLSESLVESKFCEKNDDQTDESLAGDIVAEIPLLPSPLLAKEEQEDEGLSEKVPFSSSLVESEAADEKNDEKLDATEPCNVMPQAVMIGSLVRDESDAMLCVQTDASDACNSALETLAMEYEDVEGASNKVSLSSSKPESKEYDEKNGDGMQSVAYGAVPKTHPLGSLLAEEEQEVEGSSEKIPPSSSLVDSGGCDDKNYEQKNSSQASGFVSGTPAPLTTEKQEAEGSSDKAPLSCSLESEDKDGDQIDASEPCTDKVRGSSSLNVGAGCSSVSVDMTKGSETGMEEIMNEDISDVKVDSRLVEEELKIPETETDILIDVSHGSSKSETALPSSSSLVTVGSPAKSPKHAQVGSVISDDQSANVDPRISSPRTEAANLEGSSEKIPEASDSVAAEDNQTHLGETNDKSESINLTSSSQATEEKELDHSAEKGSASSPKQRSDSTESDANKEDQGRQPTDSTESETNKEEKGGQTTESTESEANKEDQGRQLTDLTASKANDNKDQTEAVGGVVPEDSVCCTETSKSADSAE